MVFKISKDYSRTAEKKENLSAALKYVLLVHRNLLKYSIVEEILLESVQCERNNFKVKKPVEGLNYA
jgi:hypothetical protein